IIEAALAGAVLVAVLAALIPMLGSGVYRSGMMVSANNLRRISDGCAAYEATWNGRQWSKTNDAMGHYNGCGAYANSTCPPALVLGTDASEGLWGYWIAGNVQGCTSWPGTCGNWPLMMPIAIGGTTGSVDAANAGIGSWNYVNARGLREYVATRYYDPVFFSPNDEVIYQKLQVTAFGSAAEFAWDAASNFFTSTYGLSPAAIWGVGTFRAPRDGGFRAPDDYPQAYITPTASIAAYPDTKTRLIEQRWCQQPPALAQLPASTTDFPYRFNAGPGSQPGAIFYDGHVAFVPMSTFAADDAMAAQQTGDGLWSRDTPYGAGGVWADRAIGGFRSSAHLLTTEGILGRDLLKAK
ncbi:MAG: hypothetical protein EBU70_09340, partial [Actinobacteria bacterium]|nr:hypothetical protein [Actinomycetota bacterium]